jgi:uncharacterized protein (DUF1697 family)
MAGLRSALAGAGFSDVRTHLQTGNLIFTPDDGPNVSESAIESVIHETFGLEIRAIIRTKPALADVVSTNPLLEPSEKTSNFHVVFLRSQPDREHAARLDPDRSPPDRFVVADTEKEIYLHYPGGSGRSKLSLDYFERTLGVVGTARNWNTVTRLLELLES